MSDRVQLIIIIFELALIPLLIYVAKVVRNIDRDLTQIKHWAFGALGTNGAKNDLERLRRFKHAARNNFHSIAARLFQLELRADIDIPPEQSISFPEET